MCDVRIQHTQTSVVIVTYNNRDDIDACLGSLQTYSPDTEIIVVDNLSFDGTLDHIRQQYPHVRAVSSGRNGGFGAGNNIGAGLATGTHLVFLNPDTEVQAGWLAPLIAALDDPGVGLVTPTILLKGTADRVNTCGNVVHLTGLTFCAGLNEPAPPLSARTMPVAAISGAAFVLRRTLWEQLGGFDEQFFMYLEDTDLSLRARRLGYTILHVPASRVWHDYRVSVSAAKLYHLERNRLLMLRKNLSPATLALLSPALALTEVLTWVFCLQHGKAYVWAKWRSYRSLWRGRRIVDRSARQPAPRYADHALVHSFSPRLALEQMQRGVVATTANYLLTVYYVVWRRIALFMLSDTGKNNATVTCAARYEYES